MEQWKIGILLFNEVEVLDFAGPYEVFSITASPGSEAKPFIVKTIAEKAGPIRARNGLQVVPDYSFADDVTFDIVIVPGGYGAEEIELHNPSVIKWIKAQIPRAKIMASVCTGAFLLAEAGLLDGLRATTHWMDIDRLAREYEQVTVERGVKYVDEGSVITSGGISAGINMAFFLVGRILGEEAAQATAKRMEYDIFAGSSTR